MDDLKRLSETVEKCVRPTTQPVAIKMARSGEISPSKAKCPLTSFGNPVAVCQGMSMARTLGWTLAFRKEDHACPFPAVFMGHVPPDEFLKGETASYYVGDAESAAKMESAFPRWPMGEYEQVWLSPLSRFEYQPDAVVVYGNPAQIMLLIQAANYANGDGVNSMSFGRAGCVGWLVGVIKSGRCTYMVPGPGERVFAGTQDHEISFAIPASRFAEIAEGLEYVRKQGMFRYPVPNMQLLAEPKMPEKYSLIQPKKE